MEYEFSPRPVPTVLAILAALAFLSLGIWQTVRFFERSGIESLQRDRKELPVTTLEGVAVLTVPEMDFRQVEAVGRFEPSAPTFLVAFRRHLGHQGCWAITPLTLTDGSVVLVVRGFVIQSAPGQSGQCEAPPLPEGTQSFKALVHTPPPNPIDRAARAAEPAPATIWQSFDIEGMYQKLENDARPPRDTALILDYAYNDPPTIFAGDDVVAPYLSSTQHLSYAGTWFMVVLIVSAIWGGVSVRKIRPTNTPA